MVSLPVQGHFLGIIKEYNLNIRMLENLKKECNHYVHSVIYSKRQWWQHCSLYLLEDFLSLIRTQRVGIKTCRH